MTNSFVRHVIVCAGIVALAIGLVGQTASAGDGEDKPPKVKEPKLTHELNITRVDEAPFTIWVEGLGPEPWVVTRGDSEDFGDDCEVVEMIEDVSKVECVLSGDAALGNARLCVTDSLLKFDCFDGFFSAPPCRFIQPITALTMTWDGPDGMNLVAEGGEIINGINNGDVITFSYDRGAVGTDLDVTLSGSVIGESRFHVSCSDRDMNGVEDCGANQGNGKEDSPGLINDFLFGGMTGENGSIGCPGVPGT